MISPSAFSRLSRGRALFVLGVLTTLIINVGIFLLVLIMHFAFHWENPLQAGVRLDFVIGTVAVALLNVLLWWLLVVVHGPATMMDGAILAGILCGIFGPTLLQVVTVFSGWLLYGYFLNFQGMPSTNWQEISDQWLMGSIISTICFSWLFMLLCIPLNRWMVRMSSPSARRRSGL